MKNKNGDLGFTLIELLAVILILAILLLIAIPITSKIIRNAKINAFKDSSLGISKAGSDECNQLMLRGNNNILDVSFEDRIETSENSLKGSYSGKNPDFGHLLTNNTCNTSLAFYNENLRVCAYKDFNDDNVMIIDMNDKTKCRLKPGGGLDTDYVDTSSTGYMCSNPGSTVATEEKYFIFDQLTGTISGYSSDGPKDLVIPCTIGGKNVNTIGSRAFQSKSLTSVLMPDTVESIDDLAFYNNSINTLSLGSHIQTIGMNAFTNNKLVELVIPDSVKIIDDGESYWTGFHDGAFNKNNLEKITIGSGLEYLGKGAFKENLNLTKIDISKSVNLKRIEREAFYQTKLESIDLSKVSQLEFIGAYAFFDNKINELKINTQSSLEIDQKAFYHNVLTVLNIKSKNLVIRQEAFRTNLIEDLSLDSKITEIGSDAFKDNMLSNSNAFIMGRDSDGNETDVLVSYAGENRNNIIFPNKIRSINKASFSGLGLIGTINTGDNLEIIESEKFKGNELKKVTIGINMKTIQSYAFSYNLIEELDFNEGIKTIESYGFHGNKLKEVFFPDSLVSVGEQSFNSNLLEKVVFGSGIEEMGQYSFSRFTGSEFLGNAIKIVDFSRAVNLKSIGHAAFYYDYIENLDLSNSTKLESLLSNSFNRNKIKTVKLNGTNLKIYNSAFSHNDIISLEMGGSQSLIGDLAFSENKISSLVLRGNQLSIASCAFYDNLIEDIDFQGNIISIGIDAFKKNNLPDSKAFIMNRDANGNETGVLNSYGGANRTNIVIPDNVVEVVATFNNLGIVGSFDSGKSLKNISTSMFSYSSLTNVIIGDGVEKIEKSAFSNNKIVSATFGSRLKLIECDAFSNNSLETLNLNEGLEEIKSSAFSFNMIKNLVLPDSLIRITYDSNYSRGAFDGNPLGTLVLGKSIEEISHWSFANTSLTSVDFSKTTNLKIIGIHAFSSNLLSNLKFYGSNLEICVNAFSSNYNLTSIDLNNSVSKIDEGAFSSLKLQSINIDYDNVQIGKYAFSNNQIVSVSITGNNISIGDHAFDLNQIETLNLTGKIVDIGVDAFKNNKMDDEHAYIYGRNFDGSINSTLVSYAGTNRNNIRIPDTITSLANASFSGLGLTGNLDTGDGLIEVEKEKFANNTLTNVRIGLNVKVINESAFSGNNIIDVDFSDNVTTIKNKAFSSNKIEEIILPDALTNIIYGRYCPYWCYGSQGMLYNNPLRKVTFGSNITNIESYGFGDISTLEEIDMSRANKLKKISNNAFINSKISKIILPSSVAELESEAFNGLSSLTEILIKGKVDSSNFTSLGTSWNGNCKNIVYELASCFIYSGNTITDYVEACSKNVEIPSSLGGNIISTIAPNAFAGKGLIRAVIPSSVTSIGDNSFNNNDLDPIVVLGKASASDFASTGANWNGSSKTVYENNQDTCFNVNSGEITKYYNDKYCSRSVTIPSGVTTISNDIFKNVLLDSITVRDGTRLTNLGTIWNGTVYKVNFVGDSYDYNCFTIDGTAITGYKKYCNAMVDLSKKVQDKTITSVADNAFKNTSITSLILGSSINSIGNSSFENNDLTSIVFNDELLNIGSRAFYDTGLIQVTLPTTVNTIGSEAFAGNQTLATINIRGKSNLGQFTNLGVSWNGTCSNIQFIN